MKFNLEPVQVVLSSQNITTLEGKNVPDTAVRSNISSECRLVVKMNVTDAMRVVLRAVLKGMHWIQCDHRTLEMGYHHVIIACPRCLKT